MDNHFDVIVIGAGASGMMAAGTAATHGRRVLLIEKNKTLGNKLSITGGGRCNITNAEFDIHSLLAQYGSAQQFLYSAFAQFGVQETFDFFDQRGLPIIVQDRKRAFPNTERASDVVGVMQRSVTDAGVVVMADTHVLGFLKHSSGNVVGVETNKGNFSASSYVIATGGMSHPETGSTGDGFQFLRDLGHTVSKPTPNVVPLGVAERWISALSGISNPDVAMHFYSNTKKVFSKRGPLLFTHFGISGPTVLNASSRVADILHSGLVLVHIDMYPEMNIGECEKHIIAIFDQHKNKTLKTIIRDILRIGDADVWSLVFPFLNVPVDLLETKVHSICREQRKSLVRIAKSLPLTITHLMDFDRAVVADGGVVLSEIDMKTMQSKIHSNIYVTGDLLHINRPSGGYSLQLCWTTGFVAGSNVSFTLSGAHQ